MADKSQNKSRNIRKILELLKRKKKVRMEDLVQLLNLSNRTISSYLREIENVRKVQDIEEDARKVVYVLAE